MHSIAGHRHHILLPENTVETEEHPDRKQHSCSEENVESRYGHTEPAGRKEHPHPCCIEKLIYQKPPLDMDIRPPYSSIGSYCGNPEQETRPELSIKTPRGGKHIAADEDRSMAEKRKIYLTMRIRSIDGASGSHHRKIIEETSHNP